jgi:predicted permease
MLACAGALVLLAGSGNAAGVLLTDGLRREGEMAIRRAHGAGRAQLVRLILVKSVVWSVPGGLLALVFGGATLLLVDRTVAGAGAHTARLILVPWVAAGGTILTLTAGLTAGLASAWQLRGGRLTEALKEGGLTASTGRRGRFATQALLALQVAATATLVFGAGLLLRSMWNILAVDPGFDARNAVVVQIQLPRATYPAEADQSTFYERALTRIRALPDVSSAGIIMAAPLSNTAVAVGGDLAIETAQGTVSQLDVINAQFVTPGYFGALGLRLVRGERFTDDHYRDNAPVLLVDEAFCRTHLQGTEPLEAGIRWGDERLAVIGVVADVRQFGLTGSARPTVYVLHSRIRRAQFGFLVVRTFGKPEAVGVDIVREMRIVDPSVCLDDPRTLESLYAARLSQRRRLLGLVGSSAMIVLLLTGMSMLGTLEQFVAGYARDMATRVALGAAPAHIIGLLCGHLGRALGGGLAVGVAGGLALAGTLSAHLFGVTRTDPEALVMTVGLVLGAGVVAAAGPTWRAVRADPVRSLRTL